MKLSIIATSAFALALPSMACRANPATSEALVMGLVGAQEGEDESAHEPREADRILDTGWVIRSHEDRAWGVHLTFPVSVAWTELDLSDLSPEQLTALAVVPTAEFAIPLSERWTLQPFVGAGVAWQIGHSDLFEDSDFIGLVNGGLRTTRWQHFAERHWFGFMGEVRYDAALEGRDGLLGDWGSVDAALELRRDFGEPREGPRFQGGLYTQAFWFWDPVEIDVPGVTPEVVESQAEIGISLGSTSPYRLWKIPLPRVFLGVVVGEALSGVRIRFGRL